MEKGKSRPALLVIDCQNYFLDPASPSYLRGSRGMAGKVNRLARVAAGAGWPVVYTVHRAPARPGNLMAERYQKLPQGRECGLWAGLERPPRSRLIDKEHYSAFHRTGLERELRRMGITDIVLCGVMTHLCVDTTARHGFMLGFRPTIVADACCSKSGRYHRAALLALEHGFAGIVTSKEVLKNAG